MSKLVFVFSSMNSGKSLNILTKNYTLKEKGFRTVLMKPELDNRTETISTRLGLEEKCVIIKNDTLPSEHILKSNKAKPHFILIDEAQFLTKDQIWDLANLVDHWGITIYCYGLKLNWQGEPFTGSEELMKIADELVQVETYCKVNKGAPALFHTKLGGSDATVETGYEDLYDTVSRKVWKQWKDNGELK